MVRGDRAIVRGDDWPPGSGASIVTRMDLDLQQLLEWIQTGGVLLLLVAALFGAYRRWYVFKGEFEDERADKLEWKALAMKLLDTADRATTVAERTTEH